MNSFKEFNTTVDINNIKKIIRDSTVIQLTKTKSFKDHISSDSLNDLVEDSKSILKIYRGGVLLETEELLNPIKEDYWPTVITGKDGYTPVKGIDYNDGERGLQGDSGLKGDKGDPGIHGYTPQKGIDYFDGINGRDGVDGSAGMNGYTPQKGIDYFDGKDGDRGPAGIIGEIGPQGERGLSGEQGEIGPKGNTGETGSQGEQGLIGETGKTGLKGNKGDTGDKGDIGPEGPQGKTGKTGHKGDKGVKGDPGLDGKDGEIGPQGKTGKTGPKGDPGLNGIDGEIGPIPNHQYMKGQLRFESSDGTWGEWINLKTLANPNREIVGGGGAGPIKFEYGIQSNQDLKGIVFDEQSFDIVPIGNTWFISTPTNPFIAFNIDNFSVSANSQYNYNLSETVIRDSQTVSINGLVLMSDVDYIIVGHQLIINTNYTTIENWKLSVKYAYYTTRIINSGIGYDGIPTYIH